MELIYTYIYNYKGLNKLSLPTSSKFIFSHEGNSLKITKKDLSCNYYSDIPCTLILGKNGVGKSSVLDFINSFIYDFEGSGYCIWSENDKLIIITSNYTPPIILSEMQTKLVENNEYFFRRNKINLIKINNTIDLKSMLVGKKKKRNNSISKDLSLSYFFQGSKARNKKLLKQLISFSDHSSWARDNLSRVNTKFQFEIENSPTYKINSIIKNNEIGDKGLFGSIEYFFDTLSNRIENKNLPRYVECDLESLGFSFLDILNNEIDYDENFIVSVIFNKERSLYFLATFSYEKIIYLMLLPAIIWHLLKVSKASKDICEEVYLFCLCRVYLEEKDPAQTILETLDGFDVNTKSNSKIAKLSEYIFDIIRNIAKILENINKDPTDSLSFTVEEPKQIMELIKLVDRLPSGVSSRFKYGWDSLSSGEFAKLNLFNQLYDSIEHSNSKNLIILLDECDLYLHPEWQRVIFSEILDLILRYKNSKNIQLVFTTHSPILASDFLPSDIIYLERNQDQETYSKKVEFGFGATISELYINGFFIDATIGQHAHNYLNSIIKNSEPDNLNKCQEIILSQIKNELLISLINLKLDTKNDQNK
ncbi:TPA: AAA family ATPase [Proteus mirabilis]|uniref:AAA family ATPase n=1 Tax=Proteus mirabilis TaxID=584 RepID=UPI001A2A89B0|nr:AAA family ATPase [Proteus mirabilis]MBI6260081.1 AAA family ATPase [Proteus mirabilis]MDC9778163.1 AAA family ATPase [Proteus mirabilis]HEK0727672.1 AAA family ATPase [Proteus mirabilis]HEK1816603.1 AAA family ATPase [Proteus mirabilis]HEK2143964.1 AAA family ATPase [Proteus mirabilis]